MKKTNPNRAKGRVLHNPAQTAKARQNRKDTKLSKVIILLERPGGASPAELLRSTGWLPHTVRAALSRLRRDRGLHIELLKSADRKLSCYRILRDKAGAGLAKVRHKPVRAR
jgi:hypothetical protein